MADDRIKDDGIPKDLQDVLLVATAPVQPKPDRAQHMLDRVRERIDATDTAAVPTITELLTVSVDDGEWVEPMPGNKIKMLRADADTQSFLVRFDPGTRFPAHSHPEDEETLVLEGEVQYGDLTLRAGDYHLARKGSFHEEIFCKAGCLLFIRAGTAQTA